MIETHIGTRTQLHGASNTLWPARAFLLRASILMILLCSLSRVALGATSTSTSLQLSSSAGTITPGTVITLKATVTDGNSNPITRGLVHFCDAAAPFCTDVHIAGVASLTSSGQATLSLRPGLGQRTYKAVFLGTTSYSGSSSATESVTVSTASSSTVLSQIGSPGNYTLTAAVSGTGAWINGPTGSASFIDSTNAGYILGVSALSPPTTTFNFPSNKYSPEYPTGTTPHDIQVGDFNGDGYPDLVVSSSGSSEVTVLLGNGDGTFRVGSTISSLTSAYGLAVGDFNGDGKLDIAVSLSVSSTGVTTKQYAILLGKGDGTFSSATYSANLPTGETPYYISTGDINNDGIPDLLMATTSKVAVLLGNGDGTFAPAVQYPVPPGTVFVKTGDFNNDGNLDVATLSTTAHSLSILMGKGDGTFSAPVSYPFEATDTPVDFTVGDFSNDGILDIFVACSGPFWDFTGVGDGTFVGLRVGSDTTHGAIAADFTGDGQTDIISYVLGGTYNGMAVRPGRGNDTFIPSTVFDIPYAGTPTYLATADFNGDGTPDMAILLSNGDVIVGLNIITKTSTAVLSAVSPVGPNTSTHSVIASYSGDTFYTPSLSPSNQLVAEPVATGLTLTTSPAQTSPYGQQVALIATLSPFTAQAHSTDSELVTFFSGANALGSEALVSGSASINVTNLAIGTDTLRAVYSGDPNFVASSSASLPFVVTGATTTHFRVAAPITATAGTSLGGITITALTASETTDQGYQGTVTLTSSDPQAVLPSPVTLSNGSATFSATLNTIGTQAIRATDTISSAISGTSNPISVAGVDPALSLNVGSHRYGDTPFALAASTSSTASVTYVINSGPAALSGNVVTLLGAGQVTVTASQVQAAPYVAASATAVFIVTRQDSQTTLLLSSSQSYVGQSVTLTATNSPAVIGRPSGTVEFFDGGISLGSNILTAGQAVLTVQPGLGTHILQAVYAGDSNFNSSSSALSTLAISASDFTFTAATPADLTMHVGGSGTVRFLATPNFGTFSSPLKLSYLGSLPFYAQINFTPETLASGTSTTAFTATFATTLYSSSQSTPNRNRPVELALLLVPVLLCRRRTAKSLAAVILLGGITVGTSGCGSGYAEGMYDIVIAATSGTYTHTQNITVHILYTKQNGSF